MSTDTATDMITATDTASAPLRGRPRTPARVCIDCGDMHMRAPLDPGTVRRAATNLCMRCYDARRHDWSPRHPGRATPLPEDQIIDQIAVERAAAGDRTLHLTGTEMRLAAAEVTSRGYSVAEAAEILGIRPRTIQRWAAA